MHVSMHSAKLCQTAYVMYSNKNLKNLTILSFSKSLVHHSVRLRVFTSFYMGVGTTGVPDAGETAEIFILRTCYAINYLVM